MKNKCIFLKPWPVMVAAALFFAFSCNNPTKNDDEESDLPDNEGGMTEDDNRGYNEDDAQFITEATEINLEEIKLGELAMDKAALSDVNEMGEMMHTDHLVLLDEITELGERKNMRVPTDLSPEGQSAYDKLKDLTGHQFDKTYCEMMVEGHKKAIEKFEKAANDAEDADIRAWANSTLPDLKKHLEHAKHCQEKTKNAQQ